MVVDEVGGGAVPVPAPGSNDRTGSPVKLFTAAIPARATPCVTLKSPPM